MHSTPEGRSRVRTARRGCVRCLVQLSLYSAEVAVPFMSTGPVGWPVGDPPGGSTLMAKSCSGATRGT